MIKTNELRIGNLLLWHVDGSYELTATVTEIFEDTFSVHLHGSLQANGTGIKYDFKPMPITLEWLERLGFEKGYKGVFNKDNLCVEPAVNKYQPVTMGHDDYVEYGLPIQYVHQLQNLYFTLTGEELIIKE